MMERRSAGGCGVADSSEWYRLFVGDVSNDVSERTLDDAFSKYPSYCKCKVVRDRLSQKVGARRWKVTDATRQSTALSHSKTQKTFSRRGRRWTVGVARPPLTQRLLTPAGKYVGNRPIRLSKIKEDKYGGIDTTTISVRKVSG